MKRNKSKDRSFVPSDFSLRDVPGFLIGYVAVSAICVGLGLVIQTIPSFGKGLLCGVGLGFFAALAVLYPKKKIDITTLPEPSSKVKEKCNDPNSSFVGAVKLYREETGVSLTEAAAVLRAYQAKKSKEYID
ncbi:MAG: hypothetical protein K9M75_03335 [Phycisphaerae bacterium]|nr:hypothetical protein [Phycisphaerae bacterium]